MKIDSTQPLPHTDTTKIMNSLRHNYENENHKARNNRKITVCLIYGSVLVFIERCELWLYR